MSEALRKQIKNGFKLELEAIGYGEPLEACGSTHRLLILLFRCEDGALQVTSRRVGENGVHDVTGILATLDVTLYENNPAYVSFLGRFTGKEVPVDDDGCVDPDWIVDGETLAEAEEEAWEFHSNVMLDEWVDEALTQIKAATASKSPC